MSTPVGVLPPLLPPGTPEALCQFPDWNSKVGQRLSHRIVDGMNLSEEAGSAPEGRHAQTSSVCPAKASGHIGTGRGREGGDMRHTLLPLQAYAPLSPGGPSRTELAEGLTAQQAALRLRPQKPSTGLGTAPCWGG